MRTEITRNKSAEAFNDDLILLLYRENKFDEAIDMYLNKNEFEKAE